MLLNPTVRAELALVPQVLRPERVAELRVMAYVDYLKTPEWRRRRDRAIRLSGFKCSACQKRGSLQVHHVNYAHLGEEWETDLEVLCRGCHEGHHFDESRRQHLGVYVRLVSDAMRAGHDTSFADVSTAVRELCLECDVPFDPLRVSRAYEALGTNRLPRRMSEKVNAVVAAPPDCAVGRAEAVEICRRLNIVVCVKSMPGSFGPMDPDAVNRFRRAEGLIP